MYIFKSDLTLMNKLQNIHYKLLKGWYLSAIDTQVRRGRQYHRNPATKKKKKEVY